MIIFLLVISVLVLLACFLVYYKRRKIKFNWPIILLPGILAITVIFLEFSLTTPVDSRYVEYPAECIRHYPEWTEIIRPSDTTRKESENYGSSLRDYPIEHHEYFAMMYRGDGDEREMEKEIPKITYEYFSKLWGETIKEDTLLNTRGFIRSVWNKDMYNALIYTKTKPYVNYFQNILRLYNFESISDKEASSLGLYPRARLDFINEEGIFEPRQSLIYGIQVSDSISRAASYVSTVDHKFRPILLVWEKKGEKSTMISKQRSYWNGGKDNEVVFCVCVNDLSRKQILWSGSFSWSENRDFEDYVIMGSLHPGEKLDIPNYINCLMGGYQSGLWKPRDFQTYNIAQIPLGSLVLSLLGLTILILDIILIYKLIIKRNKNTKNDATHEL